MVRKLAEICLFLIVLQVISIKFFAYAIFRYEEEIEKHRLYYENLKKIVNNDFDPCKNPIDYVCYNPGESESINSVFMDETSQEWLTSDSKENLTIADIKARHFYESCLKSNVTETYFKEFQWPITEENFKLNHSIWKKFETAGWPIVIAKVIPNEVLITYGFSNMEYVVTRIESDKEKEQLLNTIIQRGISNSNAEKLVTEIVEISNRISDSFRKCPSNENWYGQIKLQELKLKFPIIDWEGIITRQLDKSNFQFDIENDLTVTVIDFKCTMDHFKFVTENMREVYNYFYWISYKTNSKWTCKNHTMKYFDSIFVNKFIMKHIDLKELELYDVNIFNILLKNMLERRENGLTNITELEFEIFRNELNRIYNPFSIRPDELNTFYGSVHIDLNDFHTNLRKMEERPILFDNPQEIKLILTAIANQHKKPLYYAFSNLYPKLLLLFSKLKIWQDGENNILKLLTFNDQQKIRKCYENDRFNVSNVLKKFNKPNIETYLESVLLKISFEDYRKFINDKNFTDIKNDFEKIGLTAEKVFFVNYAREYCSKGVLGHMKFVINEMNMNDFQNEYQCPIGTAINPDDENYCKI